MRKDQYRDGQVKLEEDTEPESGNYSYIDTNFITSGFSSIRQSICPKIHGRLYYHSKEFLFLLLNPTFSQDAHEQFMIS